MSEDEADPELLALLRQSLGLGPGSSSAPPTTRVLESAQYICDNSIDVSISSSATKAAAQSIWQLMQEKEFSTKTWSDHELHPKAKDETGVNFIFTMNLSNFSFWSELPSDQRFSIEYKDRRWTGYWSLVAALQRALDEGCPITTPTFWQDHEACPDSLFEHVFRSATEEPIPLLSERIAIYREAGQVLETNFSGSFVNLISKAGNSAAALVNLLVEHFPNFRDETVFHGKKVRLYKRAQILVADLWACFNGTSYGEFHDIDALTMFADYRIPQMLQNLGCLWYSPALEGRIKRQQIFVSGENMEVEIRGCSIWAVELLRRQILKDHPELAEDDDDHERDDAANAVNRQDLEMKQGKRRKMQVNAVLIDFFLYDTCKERESQGLDVDTLPHHRARSIWY